MQRYFAQKSVGNKFIISACDRHHIKNVMRMKNNSLVEIIYKNELYIGQVIINKNDVTIIKQEEVIHEKKDKNKITLVIPILKENKMDYIFQKGTELGVDSILLLKTERSLIELNDDKKNSRINRWQKICKEASEQSKRVDIPNIQIINSFNDLKNISGLKMICSTQPNINSLKQVLTKDDLVFVIGPEGGLTISEEDLLVKMGFIRVSLGSNIMRVETVPLYLLSVVSYNNME